jgi:putative transposase
MDRYRISERRACRAVGWPRSSQRYRSVRPDLAPLRMRLKELALARPRYGYRRLHVLLGREGWRVNHKKVLRLYREEGLTLRIPRQKRKYASWVRVPLPRPTRPNQHWTADFVSDALADGRRIRVLTVLDVCSRECLALEAAMSFPADRVTQTLDRVIAERKTPTVITLDHGTEFTGRRFDAWAYRQGIRVDFIRPGRPVENAFIESFNGRLRDECLNTHWWHDLDEARRTLEDWRRDYNEMRPHSSLADLVPTVYVAALLGSAEAVNQGA